MTPTPEQEAIIAASRDPKRNILVSALAGAAKTSTLVMVAEAGKSIPTLCLAFNKRIADEMATRLPGNCQAMTLNSLGHRAWASALGKRLVLNKSKTYGILQELIDALPQSDKEEAYENLADIMKAVGHGKANGYIPDDHFPEARRLCGDDDFFASLDEEPSELVEQLIRDATLRSLEMSWQGTIDFDDQILMPTIFPASFPQYPRVLLDEAQDLSELNHAMLRKIAKKNLIGVGDECQSIYAFRGAHQNSMALLQQQFDMDRLILSISFRCPQAVVREAQWRAPHMRWPEWAIEGTVERRTTWGTADLPDTAVMLCRNNAPLFSMAIKLLKAGRYCEVVGNDIGKALIKQMKKFGPTSMTREQVMVAIEKWKVAKLVKSRAHGRVYDQAECMAIFAEQGKNLGDALAYTEHIMSARGPITLMTGHKSKGLEFPTVFILDRHLLRTEEHQQEENLLYVMQTRAKERLVYVETEGFDG